MRNYKDFLRDNKFIIWRLTGDPTLGRYWEEYISLHPAIRDDFKKAVSEFSKFRFTNGSLTGDEYAALRKRIEDSCRREEKKRAGHYIRYAAAACLGLLLISGSVYYWLNADRRVSGADLLSESMIVGTNMESEDIRLITETETTSFARDISVKIGKNGLTVVIESDSEQLMQVETKATEMSKLIVPYGKRSQLTLSDGTQLWINSGSVLEFPSVFSGKQRSINLVGEVYMDVAKDEKRPFVVNTSDFQVEVYGTKFNVSAYADNSSHSVVLVEGSVGVRNASQEESVLVPNDMLVCSNRGWEKRQVDVEKYISWKDGFLVLENTSIEEVLKKVEKYYNLSFRIDKEIDLSAKRSTGTLYLSDNLDDTMTAISLLSSTTYRRENSTIYIELNP